jgi:hypothetical protein
MMSARLVVLAACLAAAGCTKLTVENYERLQLGMTYAEAGQVLGEPSKCDDAIGVRHCTWGDDRRQIALSFAGGRLVLRSATGIR